MNASLSAERAGRKVCGFISIFDTEPPNCQLGFFVCLNVRIFRQHGTSGLHTVCTLTHFLTRGLRTLPPQSDTPSPGLSLSAEPLFRLCTSLDLLGKASYIAWSLQRQTLDQCCAHRAFSPPLRRSHCHLRGLAPRLQGPSAPHPVVDVCSCV